MAASCIVWLPAALPAAELGPLYLRSSLGEVLDALVTVRGDGGEPFTPTVSLEPDQVGWGSGRPRPGEVLVRVDRSRDGGGAALRITSLVPVTRTPLEITVRIDSASFSEAVRYVLPVGPPSSRSGTGVIEGRRQFRLDPPVSRQSSGGGGAPAAAEGSAAPPADPIASLIGRQLSQESRPAASNSAPRPASSGSLLPRSDSGGLPIQPSLPDHLSSLAMGLPRPVPERPASPEPWPDEIEVKSGDTLGQIARRLARPDLGTDQISWALFDANRPAFQGSIHQLLLGSRLRVPTIDEVRRLSVTEARAALKAESDTADPAARARAAPPASGTPAASAGSASSAGVPIESRAVSSPPSAGASAPVTAAAPTSGPARGAPPTAALPGVPEAAAAPQVQTSGMPPGRALPPAAGIVAPVISASAEGASALASSGSSAPPPVAASSSPAVAQEPMPSPPSAAAAPPAAPLAAPAGPPGPDKEVRPPTAGSTADATPAVYAGTAPARDPPSAGGPPAAASAGAGEVSTASAVVVPPDTAADPKQAPTSASATPTTPTTPTTTPTTTAPATVSPSEAGGAPAPAEPARATSGEGVTGPSGNLAIEQRIRDEVQAAVDKVRREERALAEALEKSLATLGELLKQQASQSAAAGAQSAPVVAAAPPQSWQQRLFGPLPEPFDHPFAPFGILIGGVLLLSWIWIRLLPRRRASRGPVPTREPPRLRRDAEFDDLLVPPPAPPRLALSVAPAPADPARDEIVSPPETAAPQPPPIVTSMSASARESTTLERAIGGRFELPSLDLDRPASGSDGERAEGAVLRPTPRGVPEPPSASVQRDAATASAVSSGLATVVRQQIDARLELAAAYVDLGDAPRARQLLAQTLVDGDEAQRRSAQSLLIRLTQER